MADENENEPMTDYYLVTVQYCDPELIGPFETGDERDERAKQLVRREIIDPVNNDEYIFGLDIKSGKPEIFAYTGRFFEEEEDCEEGPDEDDVICPYCDNVIAPADLPSLKEDGDQTETSCEGCEATLIIMRQDGKNVLVDSHPPGEEK